jgi:hypothetical protein
LAMDRMLLVLKRSSQQQTALDQLLVEQHDTYLPPTITSGSRPKNSDKSTALPMMTSEPLMPGCNLRASQSRMLRTAKW